MHTADTSACYAIYLHAATLDRTPQLLFVNHVEALPGHLVRYWRWLNGAKNALCFTGDPDALTLLDYTGRLLDC